MPEPIPFLASETLRRAHFAHGFSTRAGGVSEPPFDSLDFATRREKSRLRENQRRLAAAVGFDGELLYQVHQVHGPALVVASGDPARVLEQDADALVAEPGSGHAVGIRVADCVPVLVADPRSGRVAAVHAGWRGVVADVIGVAVRHLVEKGAQAEALLAAIGPCIGPCCFEVGADVGETIARATTASAIARRDEARGKVFVDLRAAVRAQLLGLGLSGGAIDDVPDATSAGCTRCDAQRFYSYRRDGDSSGRLIAVIAAR